MCGAEGRGGMTASLSEDARTRGALQDGQRPATGSLSWKHTGQTDTSSPRRIEDTIAATLYETLTFW